MPDYVFKLYEAKTRLSNLVGRVAKGEEIIIAKAAKPIAKLVPMGKTKNRGLGGWEGKIRIAEDFDDPLPAYLQAAFNGRNYEDQ